VNNSGVDLNATRDELPKLYLLVALVRRFDEAQKK